MQEGGLWREAVSLPYDMHLREKTARLDFSSDAGNSPVKMRILKQGRGSGHIDSILLGGAPPARITGWEGMELRKLSARDLDIVSVDESGIELELPAPRQGNDLVLTAGIYIRLGYE